MSQFRPLWPQPIPILGLTGEYASGKTWFGISISPDPKRVRVYDLEMSATPYVSLGFDHVNVPLLLLEKYPKGYKPVDLWTWWLDDVSNLEPGKYDVVMVDPVTDLERGLTDWVQAHPQHFGHSPGQYASMSGIMWGDVKDYWKSILSGRVATKCQTFAFVAHMGAEFADKKPTGDRKPKGKETLHELATLYLQMERPKNKAGERQSVPSAIVLKSRLNHLKMGPDGPEIREALPPRLPVATPKAVREYMLNPPDFAKLKDGEKVPEKVLTADERLRLEVAKAEAERDSAMLQAEREGKAAHKAETAREARSAREQLVAATLQKIVAADTADALKAVGVEIKSAKVAGLLTDEDDAVIRPVYTERKKVLTPEATAAAGGSFPVAS